jgi:uracil-DNA glycosylase
LAWNQVLAHLKVRPRLKFGHAAVAEGRPRIVASYHPSQQNTFTGKLTEPMLDEAVAKWLA